MIKKLSAVCLISTALTIPALAQSSPNSTQDFVTKAAVGGMFEIQSSQLALKKSQDQDIRTFAQKMIDDHSKADDKLKSLAKNEKVPTSLDQQHEQMLKTLEGDNGSNFASQFKQMQVSAHQQTIDLFQNYAQQGSDQQIKQFAEQTLPTLKQHLQMAQQITIASNATGSQQTAQNATAGGAATQQVNGHEFMTKEQPGTWRASKMIGIDVYNEQNQKVGDINEVLLDKSGKADGVVIGVGGFLGIGERNVAVAYNQLKWSMTPVNSGASTNPTNTTAVNTAPMTAPGTSPSPAVSPSAGMPPTANRQQQPATYPDHAILANASKDQLQNAPRFQYGDAPK